MSYLNLNGLLMHGLVCMAAMVPFQVFSDQAKESLLSIDPAGAIRICNEKSDCKNIVPAGDLRKAIDDGYEHISIVDIYKDGNQELAATSAGGCSRFFIFNRATYTFSILSFGGAAGIFAITKLTEII